jgi:L-rhamnose isomerase/sugar isomerase
MTARAELVDVDALAVAQESGDVLGANEIFMDAFYTDVRPAMVRWRADRGLPEHPMRAFAESGYQETVVAERVGGTQSSWGA